MENYDEMRRKLMESARDGKLEETAEKMMADMDSHGENVLDSLLNPQNHAPVVQLSECVCPNNGKAACEINCLFEAIKRDENGKLIITSDCVGCGECVKNCKNHVLAERSDLVALIDLLRKQETPVYAMIAPAFSGQFSKDVTSGKLRSAFKYMGFYGMLEVALFADIITLKEALEFDRSIHTDKDFLLTSCCCPMWVALIKKSYSSLIPHVPPSVSPMVACGRSIKRIHPEAKTVFIGPCLAKKAEAKEPDIADAVDFVLTFQEVKELFEMLGVDPAKMPEDKSDHSSTGGRLYARTGGVSEAVRTTLNRLNPDREIKLKAQQANGIRECKEMLKKISEGEIHANFIEGMGCVGGCVGGPKRLIPTDKGREHVNAYAAAAPSKTPADNPHVLEVLHRLGFTTVEGLLDRDNTFIRHFDVK